MLKEIMKLDVKELDYEGLGICKVNNFPIFVKNALPGEVVNVLITKQTKNLAFGQTINIIQKSSRRQDVICEKYNECGGCNLMHMDYALELEFKKHKVITTLKKVGNIETLVNDVVENEDILHYRNKVIMHIDKNVNIYRGFYKEGTHDMVEIKECFIENKLVKEVVNYILNLLNSINYPVYQNDNIGLKSIMFRTNYQNEMMIVLVVTHINDELAEILKKTSEKFNFVVSTYININNKNTNVVLGKDFYLITGNKELIEDINENKFLVSPKSFLQVNNKQTNKLYQKVLEYASLTKEDTVIDAYCGIGSISLYLAKYAKHVIGIEIVDEAINNANNNKTLNGIENATFICGKCEEEIIKLKDKEKIDVIVFDPPRKGCDITFLDTVISMNIKKVVYVSCKVQTFARDARYLIDHGYELVEITPFDLFSRSSHVETVCCLSRKSE